MIAPGSELSVARQAKLLGCRCDLVLFHALLQGVEFGPRHLGFGLQVERHFVPLGGVDEVAFFGFDVAEQGVGVGVVRVALQEAEAGVAGKVSSF